jgi:hypothetical protein
MSVKSSTSTLLKHYFREARGFALGNGFGLPAIRHDHIRNDDEVRSMAGSVVL